MGMELPFLKNKQKYQGGGVVMAQVSDGKSDDELMNHVAQELMDAFEKKDIRGLRDALSALVLYILDEDAKQDGEM